MTTHAVDAYLDSLGAHDNDACGQWFPEDGSDDPHAGCISRETLCDECWAYHEADMADAAEGDEDARRRDVCAGLMVSLPF